MSFLGHILCRSCKLKLSLGKLRRDEAGRPTGFRFAGLSEAELGMAALRFLAEHVKHDLIVAGDDRVYDSVALREYDLVFPGAGPEGPAFERIPGEPLVEREKRLRTGWVHPADRSIT